MDPKRILALACLAGALGPPAPSRAEPPAAPVFPAGVELVAFDAGVVDSEGHPVPGLGPDDFALAVDGREYPVASTDFVLQTGAALGPPPSPSGFPPAFSSNEGFAQGRLLLLVVDQGNLSAGRGRDAAAAAQILLDGLGPADRVGLLTLPGDGPREELTSDHARVREALRKVSGRGLSRHRRISLLEALAYVEDDDHWRWEDAVRRECPDTLNAPQCESDLRDEAWDLASQWKNQSERSLASLASAFAALRRIEGSKVVVLLAEGLGLAGGGSRARAVPELDELARSAAEAGVSLFVVRVRPASLVEASGTGGVVVDAQAEDQDALGLGLSMLAERTRGAVFAGSPVAAVARVGREISAHYLVGFEPEAALRDGRLHDLVLRARRPGITVRTRRAVVVPAPGQRRDDAESLAATLRTPGTATGLPLRVCTWSLRDVGSGQVRVLIRGEVGGRGATGGLVAGHVLLDSRGRVVSTALDRPAVPARPGEPLSYAASATLEPGLYNLRLAARDAAGRQGSVDHAVRASLTEGGGLLLSDLLLGHPPPPPGPFRPAVSLVTAGEPFLARLEVDEAAPGTLERASVGLSLSPEAPGPAPRELPLPLGPGSSPGRGLAQGLVAAEGLEPGRWLARAVVRVDGREVGSASHPFEVAAR